jgi:hypothetical protein
MLVKISNGFECYWVIYPKTLIKFQLDNIVPFVSEYKKNYIMNKISSFK